MVTREWASVCPHCGKRQEAMTNFGGDFALPKPGSIALCFTCRRPWLFDDNLQPRKPTEQEAAALAKNPHIQEFLRMKQEGRTPKGMI